MTTFYFIFLLFFGPFQQNLNKIKMEVHEYSNKTPDYILLTRGKHLHDRIISLRGEVWVYKTSLTPSLFIKVSEPIQERKRWCIYVLKVSIYLFLRFWYFIWELFGHRGIFCFSFY